MYNISIDTMKQIYLVYGMKLIKVNILFCFAAKDESKSPVRTSGRLSVTAPPSRKTSTANNVSSASKFIFDTTFLLLLESSGFETN